MGVQEGDSQARAGALWSDGLPAQELPALGASVLVLDSGIGGITVVRAMRAACPGVRVTYLADDAWFPYGRLSPEVLTGRVRALVAQALERWPLDAVVVACNTATTVAMAELRAGFDLPFVGVVPPVKTAGLLSRTRTIALLATVGTAASPTVTRLIADFAADCRVLRIGCPNLAALAEDKARGRPVDMARLRADLAPLTAEDAAAVDVVVLGCTHYPILRDELAAAFRPDVAWLDPAMPVAKRLAQVLEGRALAGTDQPDTAFFTAERPPPDDLRPFLADAGFAALAQWPGAAVPA